MCTFCMINSVIAFSGRTRPKSPVDQDEFHSVPISSPEPPLTHECAWSGNEIHSVQIKLSPVLKMPRELHVDLITRDETCPGQTTAIQ